MTLFTSLNPATGERLWQGHAAGEAEVGAAVLAAREAFAGWRDHPFEERTGFIERFRDALSAAKDTLAETISRETGKPLWDAGNEAATAIGKADIAVRSYQERTGEKITEANGVRQELRHRAHGVMAVYGPYNFPAHLPGGHMIPALLAGNTVVFKPSEETPLVAELIVTCWREAGLPPGVLNLVQGGRDTGVALAKHPGLDGILFTGSYATGKKLHEQLAGRPEIMLALEMGGNNPLIVHEAKDVDAAALLTIQSAYMTSGQRCTCARRLIVPLGGEGDRFVERLGHHIGRIRIGAYTDRPEPFMGPLISNPQADAILQAQAHLRSQGGRILALSGRTQPGLPFLTPGLIDVTAVTERKDTEYFGPLLQLIRVRDFDEAIREANNTAFGLSAGLLSDNYALWKMFLQRIRAGIVNWNRPTTGASGAAPFGGPGYSGNHRPSAYYAADYCAYPVATMAADAVSAPKDIVGIM